MSSYNASDSGNASSPPKHSPFRIPALKGFLPLAEEASLSTRGQKLPGLIRNRSTTNVSGGSRRRRSSLDGNFAPGGSERMNAADAPSDLEAGISGQMSGENNSNSNNGNPRVSWNQRRESRPSMTAGWGGGERDERRLSMGASILMTPQMRSMRLIGNSNPRYRWEQYWKSDEELKKLSKPLRKYYERNNYLIQQYIYIDRLLDSSLPHNLIQEYQHNELYNQVVKAGDPDVPPTVTEETSPNRHSNSTPDIYLSAHQESGPNTAPGSKKIKRTPKALYRHQDNNETTPLINPRNNSVVPEEEYAAEPDDEAAKLLSAFEPEEETSSSSRIVTVAININLAANTALLIMKVVATVLTSSVSVLASLVDAALDFLSTAIVWITTRLISRSDQYAYPVGRRRLEPIGVLVFSVIMVTSFVQVAIQGLQKLTGPDREIVQLSVPAIAIMAGTVVIKFACWLWCRMVKNSSVQALAQDAMTDVVFNTFSIIFPLIGYYARIWWLDPLGGVLLSLYVIINWSRTSTMHIRNLTGAAATADERNVLLYLTMRFAKSIRQIQGLQAYHAGDTLNVEVDIVLDESMSLRDSHDLGESLQYVLESVPGVERAFVHQDYTGWNLPSHMVQGDDDDD